MRKILFLLLSLIFAESNAQNAFDVDPTFNALNIPLNHYFVTNDVIKSTVLLSGKILVIELNKKLIRLDGNTIDTSFNSGAGFEYTISPGNMLIRTFCEQPDGKILVLGNFNKYNGVTVKPLVRLNEDGTLDTSFNVQGIVLQDSSYNENPTIVVDGDGKILVALSSTTTTGIFNNLKRFLPNGQLDTTFSTNANPTYNYGTVAVQPDGKYVVSHNAPSDFYSDLNNISRLNNDGTFDTSFTTAVVSTIPSTEPKIKYIAVSNDKIYVGGCFLNCSSNARRNFVRLNSNGTVDTSFTIGSGFSRTNSNLVSPSDVGVSHILIDSNNKVIVGGKFDVFNGVAMQNIVRLNSNGSLDTTFANPFDYLNMDWAKSLSFFSNGKILASGPEGFNNNKESNFLAVINPDGTRDTNYNNSPKGFYKHRVYNVIEDPVGNLYCGGDFFVYNGEQRNFFVKLNTNGLIDNTMNYGGLSGFDHIENDYVNTISFNKVGDKIFAAGPFTKYNGQNKTHLVKLNLDGSLDTSFNFETSFYDPWDIKSIIELDNGRVVVGGSFTEPQGTGLGLVSMLPNGTGVSYYSTFGSNITVLKRDPTGKIIIGGNGSTDFRGISRRLGNIGSDTTFSLDPQITTLGVDDVLFQSDSKLIIVGSFTVNGVAKKILRLNNDGSLDPTFSFVLPSPFLGITGADLTFDQKLLIVLENSDYNQNNRLARLLNDGSFDPTIPQKDIEWYTDVKVTQNGKILLYNRKVYSDLCCYYDTEAGLLRLEGEDYSLISGSNKVDFNLNGCDNADVAFPNLKLSAIGNTTTMNYISNNSGNYAFYVESGQQYTVAPALENPAYFSVNPTSFQVDFINQTGPVMQDFCLTPNGIHDDVEILLIPKNIARNGFNANYRIIYKNKGTETSNGSITLTYNESVSDLVTSNPVLTSQTTNNITWDYESLLPFETRTIDFTLNLNGPTETPPLNIGDVLNYAVVIGSTTTDETPNNNSSNLHQEVFGSYDPNDKVCIEGTTVQPDIIGEYVHYVIRFENTGNYPAENIIIKDIIDQNKLDITTLIPLHSSHTFYTRIHDNTAEFVFDGINLPFNDANNDGYVAFKIKTKSNLMVGDTFSNDANIYFDYNYPITTNTFTTTIQALGTVDFEFDNYFVLYPNPSDNQLTIQSKENLKVYSLEIYNLMGQIVMAVPNSTESIDVSRLQSGSYVIKMNTEKGVSIKRFIKK